MQSLATAVLLLPHPFSLLKKLGRTLLTGTGVAALLFCGAFVVAMPCYGGESPTPKQDPRVAPYKDIQLLANALSIVQFAAKPETDKKVFSYAALDGMTRALDKHSFFVPPELAGLFIHSMKSRYVGLGINIARADAGAIEIVAVEPDGPAFRAGILPKDKIVAVEGKPLKDMKFVDALGLLGGPDASVGSKVLVSVARQGAKKGLDFVVTREMMGAAKVESKVLEGLYGYIRLTRFSRSATSEFKTALDGMVAKTSLKGLVIDLRNNPGGETEASLELAKLFVGSGQITSFESNYPAYKVKVKGDGPSAYTMPVLVLVNDGSASASELFAGALQFNKRARLVGKKTYGKNAVQTFMPLSADAGLYVTIAHFFMPDGRSIEGVGLTPDVIVDKDGEMLGRAIQLMKASY